MTRLLLLLKNPNIYSWEKNYLSEFYCEVLKPKYFYVLDFLISGKVSPRYTWFLLGNFQSFKTASKFPAMNLSNLNLEDIQVRVSICFNEKTWVDAEWVLFLDFGRGCCSS